MSTSRRADRRARLDKVGRTSLHCLVCGQPPGTHAARLEALRPMLQAIVHEGIQNPPERGWVCSTCLARIRLENTTRRLEQERGELSAVERAVAGVAAAHEAIAQNLDEQFARRTSKGQRLADAVARVGGSWPFVAGFGVFLVVWMLVNAMRPERAFDPYPFILLNLVLSCLAAIQAPIIMMSQNRMAARDRAQADQDFRINLKAELEVAALHEKMDHLLHSRWEHLVELQEVQLELLESLIEQSPGKSAPPPR